MVKREYLPEVPKKARAFFHIQKKYTLYLNRIFVKAGKSEDVLVSS